MVQENSAITIAILCSMGGSVRVPSEQSQWPTAAVVIKHEPEAWSSTQMFSFWCWNSKNVVQSSKEATHQIAPKVSILQSEQTAIYVRALYPR